MKIRMAFLYSSPKEELNWMTPYYEDGVPFPDLENIEAEEKTEAEEKAAADADDKGEGKQKNDKMRKEEEEDRNKNKNKGLDKETEEQVAMGGAARRLPPHEKPLKLAPGAVDIHVLRMVMAALGCYDVGECELLDVMHRFVPQPPPPPAPLPPAALAAKVS